MLACLDQSRYVKCLSSPLEKTKFELNFSATEMACCSTIIVCFTRFVVRARLDTSYAREATLRRANLFREIFQVVDRIVTKSARFA